MWLKTNPTLEQEPVLISNLIGKRMKTRGARHRKLEVFFFQFALLVSCAFLCSPEKLKKKKKAPVSLSEWIFLTPRVRVAHHSFKSLQRTSKKFSNRKDGKFELVSSLSYSVHKYDAYRNCLTVCEPHMHRPHDNSSSSLCGSVVKQWNAKSEDLTFDSSWGQLLCPMFETRRMNLFLLKLPIFLFFYFESVLTLRPIAMRPITKLTRSNLFTKTISKWVLKDILYSLLGSTAFNYVVFWITLFKCRVISWSRSSC